MVVRESRRREFEMRKVLKYEMSTKWYRFELLTESEAERERLEKVLKKHNLSRRDLAIILFGLRVRPEFGKEHFGI